MAKGKDWQSQAMRALNYQIYSSPRVMRRKVQKLMKKQGIVLSNYEAHLITQDIIASRKRGEMGQMYTL